MVRLVPSESGDFYTVETGLAISQKRVEENYPLLGKRNIPVSSPSAGDLPSHSVTVTESDPSVSTVDDSQTAGDAQNIDQSVDSVQSESLINDSGMAPALSLDAVEVVVERVSVARKGLVENIGVEIVPTESALPSEIQKQAEKDGATGEVEGVLHNGTVYSVADKMTSEAHVEEVLLHAAAGHQGGRWLFGKDVSQAYNKLYLMLGSKGVKEVSARHGINC